jgi:hypothetical protein
MWRVSAIQGAPMNNQDSGLSFERVVFFSDAVFAIVMPIAFAFIPVFARVLDSTSKKSKQGPATANEEAAA